MRFSYIIILVVATTIDLLLATGNAWSCPGAAPPVTAEDLKYPPTEKNIAAFKAKILKITPPNPVSGIPHNGFRLDLKIDRVVRGSNLGNRISIDYGSCHNLPGKLGDTINVLAIKNKTGGWSAPQFWTSGKENRDRDLSGDALPGN